MRVTLNNLWAGIGRIVRTAGAPPLALLLLMMTPIAGAPILHGGVPAAAWAQMPVGDPAEEYGVRVARVKYGGGGDWYSDPSSIPNWLSEFERRTGISTYDQEKVVSL